MTAHFDGPSDLVYLVREIDDDELSQIRQHAYRSGRVIEHDHSSLLAIGVAATIELAHGTADADALVKVRDLLARIPPVEPVVDDAVVPLCLGALFFDAEAKGTLIVPSLCAIVRKKKAYALSVGRRNEIAHKNEPFYDNASAADDGEAPDDFTLTSTRSHRDFRDRVAAAVDAIRAGDLEKVVLAREVTVVGNRAFLQHQLLERIRVLYPSCACFAIDGFLGASPELLCRRNGEEAFAHPLAGTVPRSGDPDDDVRLGELLMHSEKERSEHRFVVDAIVDTFRGLADGPVEVEGPHLLELRNVAHLGTTIRAHLRQKEGGFRPSALELAGSLHPTPAVGGVPRREALMYLAKFEELDRGRYAGPVGYVDASGDGEWWIGIRSASIDGAHARLMAGVGIVASSDPESELIETQLKLQALLATAVRP